MCQLSYWGWIIYCMSISWLGTVDSTLKYSMLFAVWKIFTKKFLILFCTQRVEIEEECDIYCCWSSYPGWQSAHDPGE